MKHKPCPIKLSIKVVESDKHAMVKALHSSRSKKFNASSTPSSSTSTTTSLSPEIIPVHQDSPDSSVDVADIPSSKDESSPETRTLSIVPDTDSEKLPPLRFSGNGSSSEGWITFDKPVTYLYAGKGPYVGLDLMQFPVSLPDDGLIDVVVQERASPLPSSRRSSSIS